MSIARTSISMPQSLMDDAVARQHQMRMASFSDYIQELIRQDVFREVDRNGGILPSQIRKGLNDTHKETAPRPERAVNYRATKRPPRRKFGKG